MAYLAGQLVFLAIVAALVGGGIEGTRFACVAGQRLQSETRTGTG